MRGDVADKRCDNGHFIDEAWDICPYCPQDESEPEIPVVRPRSLEQSNAQANLHANNPANAAPAAAPPMPRAVASGPSAVVREPLPGDWTMLQETQRHQKVAAGTAEWKVTVPAEGDATLRYRVLVRY